MNTFKSLLLLVLSLSIITVSSCKKDDDDNTPATCSNGIKDGNETGIDCGGSCSPCPGNTTKVYYFKGVINGDTVVFEDNSVIRTSSVSNAIDSCFFGVGSFLTEALDVTEESDGFALSFGGIYVGDCPAINDTAVYNNLFTLGSHGYAAGAGPSGSKIQIDLGLNSKSYTTLNVTTQPSSSTFTIVEATPIPPIDGEDGIKLKVTFNCTLEADNGDVIVITNGESVIAIYDVD